ncbi:MAG: glycine cleavage T C-terminal barrel domain-containing protein, partial [Ilumatobacteraceae bacterium]
MPADYAVTVYDALMSAGTPLGLANAGYRAIESLRLEKGYRAWGIDIGPDHTPIEAGLGWAVKSRSGVEFRGRDSVAAQRANGVRKMLAGFTCDPTVVLLGRETIFRDDERVGWLTSGGFGYTIDRSIGYGYVRNPQGVTADSVTAGAYELEVAGQRVPARVSLQPFFDPTNARVKS